MKAVLCTYHCAINHSQTWQFETSNKHILFYAVSMSQAIRKWLNWVVLTWNLSWDGSQDVSLKSGPKSSEGLPGAGESASRGLTHMVASRNSLVLLEILHDTRAHFLQSKQVIQDSKKEVAMFLMVFFLDLEVSPGMFYWLQDKPYSMQDHTEV